MPFDLATAKPSGFDLSSAMPKEEIKGFDLSSAKDDVFETMNPLMKAIDIISRPGYAVKAGIKEVMKDTEKTIPQVMSEGLHGQQRVTGNELWGMGGVSGVPLLGFATELATDPINLIPGKVLAAPLVTAAKGLKTGAEIASKVPGLSHIVDATKPLAESLKQAFITKSGIPELADLIGKHLSKREYLKGKELEFGVQTRNIIQDISRKMNQPIKDIESQIVSFIEQPNASAPEEIKNIGTVIKSRLSDMLTNEMKAGVPITALAEGNKAIEYFPRITSKEAQTYLRQAAQSGYGGNAKVWWPKVQNALQRRTADFTLDEFNKFVKDNGLESLGGRSVESFFLQKPAEAVFIRGTRSAKAITSAEFLNDVARTFGKETPELGFKIMPDSVTALNPSLAGKFFHPDVVNEVTRIIPAYIDPKVTNPFIQQFDNIQNFWKKWTLAPFAKYHLRNMVGNLWNNYLADVNPINYGKAQALQMYEKFKGTGSAMEKAAIKDLDAFGLSPQTAEGLMQSAKENLVVRHGFYGSDIEHTAKQQLSQDFSRQTIPEKIKRIVLPTSQHIAVTTGMKVGTIIEDNARLAHFLDKLSKGDDASKAALSVKKYLFDYSDLTSFEKTWMKRLMPFYTWTRKNLPLQLESLITQPKKFIPIEAALRNQNPQDLLRLKYSQPNIYERLPIQFKKTIDNITYIPLEGLIPAGDISKIARPQEILIELLNPYLKTPIELAMNKSFYTESEIEKYPKQTQELLGMDIPSKVKYAIVTVTPYARIINSLNTLIEKDRLQKIGKNTKFTREETAIYHTLTYVYKTDLKDLRTRAIQNMYQKMTDIQRGLYWAKEHKREKEFLRIKEESNRIKQEIQKVK
jgi:hypothetical protein